MERRYLSRCSILLGLCASGLLIGACSDPDEPSASAEDSSATTSATTAAATSATTASCTDEEAKFSFFLMSQAALIAESGNQDGFGGDLGGLNGADALCQKIAEQSAPCRKGAVTWRAFLSTATVNAKDRIGTGPWYDRRGRRLAEDLKALLGERPAGADAAIVNDFPNENGVGNHSPDGSPVDNHQIITGTGTDGNVYKQLRTGTAAGAFGGFSGAQDACLETWSVDAATCWGWTTKEPVGCPRVGHSWPAASGRNWMSVWNESGCAPGGTNVEKGGTNSSRKIGSAGGYGGFYCFAVTGG